jgi:signal transduction histidine kinase
MDNREKKTAIIPGHLIAAVVLLILLVYTHAKFFEHSYIGFRVDATGAIFFLFDDDQPEPTLELGDRLIQVDSVRWEDYRADLRLPIFRGIEAGQVVTLLIERDGAVMTIPWVATGPNINEILDLVVNEGWLAYFFWLAGTFALVNLRPKDDRWILIIAFNYLTAVFLVAGSGVSFYHIWEAAIVMRMAIWLCVPVYLHLHWIFAPTFRKPPGSLLWIVYSGAAALAAAEWFQWLPHGLYLYGFLAAIAGSLFLLILHAILRPQVRRDLRLLFWLSIISIAPSITTGVISGVMDLHEGFFAAVVGGGALVSLPLLPLAYLRAAYRRQLGDWELRVNRITSVYIFLILLGLVGLPMLVMVNVWLGFRESTMVVGLGAAVFATAFSIWGYPRFENWLETRVLGIPLPSKQLLERYSNHISTSGSILDLTRVLEEEILPSLLIRQFVFLYSDQDLLKALSILGVEEGRVPSKVADLPSLHSVYLSPDPGTTRPHAWIRLILPLKFGDRFIAFWLFGRRDPDDVYSQAEIPILRSLASQTGVALSNIMQTRQIKEMYEANILRHEEERLRLGRDLHDSVLNELAALLISVDAPVLSQKFLDAYEAVSQRLREIVSDLRPPMLTFGLKLAFEGLADTLMDRHRNTVQILAGITSEGDCRYPENVEIYLYRIVQEACQNALRYSHAKTIKIRGSLSPRTIDLTVADDGIGFVAEVNLRLTDMLANKHFGLANMLERADLIGAEIKIDSKPGEGTRVRVGWEKKTSEGMQGTNL